MGLLLKSGLMEWKSLHYKQASGLLGVIDSGNHAPELRHCTHIAHSSP